MNDYRKMAMAKLRNIELRQQLAKETDYTKMLDSKDWTDFLRYLQLEEQQEQKTEVVLDEASLKKARAQIDDIFKGTILGH